MTENPSRAGVRARLVHEVAQLVPAGDAELGIRPVQMGGDGARRQVEPGRRSHRWVGATTIEVATGHLAMVTHVDETTRLIEQAVAAVQP